MLKDRPPQRLHPQILETILFEVPAGQVRGDEHKDGVCTEGRCPVVADGPDEGDPPIANPALRLQLTLVGGHGRGGVWAVDARHLLHEVHADNGGDEEGEVADPNQLHASTHRKDPPILAQAFHGDLHDFSALVDLVLHHNGRNHEDESHDEAGPIEHVELDLVPDEDGNEGDDVEDDGTPDGDLGGLCEEDQPDHAQDDSAQEDSNGHVEVTLQEVPETFGAPGASVLQPPPCQVPLMEPPRRSGPLLLGDLAVELAGGNALMEGCEVDVLWRETAG
mmetsp:Transcript_2139/g.6806  ORF Transcript_2139/g.6806 Transcript_2139/m.6806 type:complete len:278 (+) Transcript_2139:951-1784(+)